MPSIVSLMHLEFAILVVHHYTMNSISEFLNVYIVKIAEISAYHSLLVYLTLQQLIIFLKISTWELRTARKCITSARGLPGNQNDDMSWVKTIKKKFCELSNFQHPKTCLINAFYLPCSYSLWHPHNKNNNFLAITMSFISCPPWTIMLNETCKEGGDHQMNVCSGNWKN